jgi:hypothetical protein
MSLTDADASVGSACVSTEQRRELQQQVATQTAALLQVAHMLQQPQLVQVLHHFVCHNTSGSKSLLYGVPNLVFTDAVIKAAVGTGGSQCRDDYIRSALSYPFGIGKGFAAGGCALLKPMGPFVSCKNTGKQEFKAQLLQDFGGCKAGDEVTAVLNVFSSTSDGLKLKTAKNTLVVPAHLQMGYGITSLHKADLFVSNLG